MKQTSDFQVREAVSAGGIVYQQGKFGLEVVMVQTPNGNWGLPKGTPNIGETLCETALREVQEETGLIVELGKKIGTTEYWFTVHTSGEKFHKTVHYWLMQPIGGSTELHDHEHITVEWFTLSDAVTVVSYSNLAEVLRNGAGILGEITEPFKR